MQCNSCAAFARTGAKAPHGLVARQARWLSFALGLRSNARLVFSRDGCDDSTIMPWNFYVRPASRRTIAAEATLHHLDVLSLPRQPSGYSSNGLTVIRSWRRE